MSKPRLAILGASGFVGSALVERLYFDGAWRDRFDFTAFIHGYGGAARLARLPVRIEAIDLLDYARVQTSLASYDFVVNCTRGDSLLMTRGVKNLVRAMGKAEVKRFVHLGSVAIYGEDPPPQSARDDAPPHPRRSDYGDMKVVQDEMVFALHRKGVPSIILCPSNIGGPYSSLIVDAVAKLLAHEIVLVDDGENATNIVHVDNLVQAILVALVSDTGWGERYFVNEAQPVTWKQFFEEMVAMLGIDYEFATVTRQAVVEDMERRASGGSVGIRRQVGMLLSREFRDGISVVPAFKAMDESAKRLLYGLSPAMRERIRRRLARPTVIYKARATRPIDHKLITAQIRRVYHSPEKIMTRLGYRPLLDHAQGMVTTRHWLEFANLIPHSHPGVEPDME